MVPKSLKQREQLRGYIMSNYDRDEVERQERQKKSKDVELIENCYDKMYDPDLRYTENDDINWPKHYTAGFGIQPLDFIMKNELDFVEGNIVKYICRYDMKGGIKDLKKARFYLDKLIEKEKKKNE